MDIDTNFPVLRSLLDKTPKNSKNPKIPNSCATGSGVTLAPMTDSILLEAVVTLLLLNWELLLLLVLL